MPMKRLRVPSTTAASSAVDAEAESDKALSDPSNKLLCSSSIASAAALFNDSSTADVVLRLHSDHSPFITDGSGDRVPEQSDIILHLHSKTLRRTKFFAVLLSERWLSCHHNHDSDSEKMYPFNLGVPSTSGSIGTYYTVLQLLYTDDFANTIKSVSIALDILPVALELLFEECAKSCVKFLEAVPWSEEQEMRVLNLIPLLNAEESQELLARVTPGKDACEEMLHGLMLATSKRHPNEYFLENFVSRVLERDSLSRELAKRVLDRAFGTSLKVVKELLSAFFTSQGGQNAKEIQRSNLQTAMTNGRHLLWLVERMIELQVADSAVKEWGVLASFTADLQWVFRDNGWRKIAPELPAVLLRCTCNLANAVAAGTILVAREVRMELVKDWLPVLIVCNDNVAPSEPSDRSLYQELQQTFLSIISTLPMSDAMELLQQFLSIKFCSSRDCHQFELAFNTWFRRATPSQQPDHLCQKT